MWSHGRCCPGVKSAGIKAMAAADLPAGALSSDRSLTLVRAVGDLNPPGCFLHGWQFLS